MNGRGAEGQRVLETAPVTRQTRVGTPGMVRRLGLAALVLVLVVTAAGTAQAVTGAEDRISAGGMDVDPIKNLPHFEIDGFSLRDVGPYSGMGAIRQVPCWKVGSYCTSAPSGAQVAGALWGSGTRTYANAPITDAPQRYRLIYPHNFRTLLLGDGMPRERRIIDHAAGAGYEAIMVNWERPNDPTLNHPLASLRRAAYWTHRRGMRFGVAMGGKIMLKVCRVLGYSNCPRVSTPLIDIAEFKRERRFMLQILRHTDMFTFQLQPFVLLDQLKWASENLSLARTMHRRALNKGARNFNYLAEMSTLNANHSLSPSSYPSAKQYLRSWRGIRASVGPNTRRPIQGLFLLANSLACDRSGCHTNPHPGNDGRIIQMTRFLRTAFTVKAT